MFVGDAAREIRQDETDGDPEATGLPSDATTTPNAISAVSPGNGTPNDSIRTATKSSGRPLWVKKWVKVAVILTSAPVIRPL